MTAGSGLNEGRHSMRAAAADIDRYAEAESDPRFPPDQAKARIRTLRADLLKAQYARLEKADRALLIVVTGLDGVGKGSTINLLNEWMDPRHIETLAFGEPTDEEKQYPLLWRYWRGLPARGRTGIVFGSWYARLYAELTRKKPRRDEIEQQAAAIRDFEALLAREGVQVLKLWFHMSRNAQKERTRLLESDPNTAWMVRPADHRVARHFKTMKQASETMLTLTESPLAPWVVIPSADDNMRAIRTAETVLETLCAPVVRGAGGHRAEDLDVAVADAPGTAGVNIQQVNSGDGTARTPRRLSRVDYSARLNDDEYESQLAQLRAELARQVRSKAFRKLPLILLFEGHDAAGKGSTIRRITHALDARQFKAVPVSAPTPEELARPYLWRFWRHLPAPGHITIFDRSWYGRVLVERVEKFAKPEQWRRAYGEINQFEEQLTHSGILLVKFWLAITKDVQLERFREREQSPFKSFKITPEDWRNREKWSAYTVAANDMFDLTDTSAAPWHVVSANDKRHARVAVLERIVTAIDARLSK